MEVALLLGELLAIRCLYYAPALAYLAHLRPQEPLLSETFPHPLKRTRLLAHRLVFLAPPTLQGSQRTRYSSETVIIHVFEKGDKYLDSDAVFGVKDSLIADFVRHRPETAPDGTEMGKPFYTLNYDFG